jgi:catechol 2,3-dioxygenase-like lactoylglutathione lyase family enzyme
MSDDVVFFHAAPVFQVRDLQASIAFYRDLLGFEVVVTWPEDGDALHAGVSRGGVNIHLSRCESEELQRSSIYVFLRGVDAYASAIRAAGGSLEAEPQSHDYGMRELSVKDPDGNLISCGQGLSD